MVEALTDPLVLEAECSCWCRYLVELEPSDSVLERYVDAHLRGIVEPPGSRCEFDRALVRFARRGKSFAQLCDVHAKLFRPAGLLRRKLVLTLALLEADEQSHRRVDRVNPGTRLGLLLLCGAWVLRFILQAALGLLIFLPLRAFCAFTGGREGVA